jgi:tetratricopeptide (TPR) repeat protein
LDSCTVSGDGTMVAPDEVLTPQVRATRRLGHQLVGVLRDLERRYRSPGGDKQDALERFDAEWPQAKHIFDVLAELYWGDTQIAEICINLPLACPSIFRLRIPSQQYIAMLSVSLSAHRMLEVWRMELPGSQIEIAIVGETGNAYLRIGNLREARKAFIAAAGMARKQSPAGEEEVWLGNLAVVFAEERRFRRAILTSTRALELGKVRRNPQLVADQKRLIGTIQMDTGNQRKALSMFFEALDAHASLADLCGMAIDLREIAGAFAGVCDTKSAAQFLRYAIELGLRAGLPLAETEWPATLGRIV